MRKELHRSISSGKLSADPDSTARRHKLSMSEITTCRWSLLDDVTNFSETGYDGIGVWRPKVVEFGEERAVELIRDSPLEVSSLSWAGGFTGSRGFSFDEAVEDARDAIRLASQLGADCVVIVSGGRETHTLTHARRLVVMGLREIAQMAADSGIQLAVQPMHPSFFRDWTFLSSVDATLEMLDLIGHPAVTMAFDAYHLWREPDLINRIEKLVPLTGIVQLSDASNSPQSEYDRALPGEGEIPLNEILNAFIDHGYNRYFDIQVWSDDVWESDYQEVLRYCGTAFDALCLV